MVESGYFAHSMQITTFNAPFQSLHFDCSNEFKSLVHRQFLRQLIIHVSYLEFCSNMASWAFYTTILAVLLAEALGYPTTVPNSPEVCLKMTPGHGPSAQSSNSPFTVEVSKTNVKGGSIVQGT